MKAEDGPILSCKGLSKRFGPVLANDAINLDIHQGRIHALLGENGAGKSTLMSMLAGVYQPDGGAILLRGKKQRFTSPRKALAAGIGMVYQRFMLVDSFTVAENLQLAAGSRLPRNRKRCAARIRELAERYGLSVDPNARVDSLSMGERQRVEILKLLATDVDILIFDEPTAILTPPEIESFYQVLRRFKEAGRTVIFITHKLEEVMAMADEISILRRGRVVVRNLEPYRVASKRELARLMVGREVLLSVDRTPADGGGPVLETRNLTLSLGGGREVFSDVSLSLNKGEVVSIVGVAGNGQRELVRALAGLGPFTGGTVRFQSGEYGPSDWNPHSLPMSYVPEDRHCTGSVPSMSLVENYMLTGLDRFGGRFFLDHGRAADLAARAVSRYDIVVSSIRQRAGSLSGGNLQKLLLARELDRKPSLLIAEQPTQGLDVRATEDIWKALLEAREHAAVLLVTGDLKEALALSDRIAVMFRGRLLAVMDMNEREGELQDGGMGHDPAIDRIGLLMAGVETEMEPPAEPTAEPA